MARNDKRVQVTLECQVCKRRNYITKKNKINDRERIELKKYCRWDRGHTLHKETRRQRSTPLPPVLAERAGCYPRRLGVPPKGSSSIW